MKARRMKIALFRALQLGDLLVAVPGFRALRQRFPHAEITLIGLPWAATFVQRYRHYIDRFVEFPGYPGIKEAPGDAERTQAFIAEQRRYGYDLAIQMHGNGQASNHFVLELGAKSSAGYYEGEPPAGLTFAAPYPHDQPEIFRNLGLAALLLQNSRSRIYPPGDVSHLDPRLEFPLFDEDYREVSMLLSGLRNNGDRPLVALHAGSRSPARRWPAAYFAALADDLAQHVGAQIILTGGAGEENIVRQVQEHMATRAIDLAGKTSLGGLAALISQLDLFVSNDTGVAHLAVAVDCPSITLFGPAEYRRWAHLDQERHPTLRNAVACSPCSYWECPIDHRCLRGLSPERVSTIAKQFLHRTAMVRT